MAVEVLWCSGRWENPGWALQEIAVMLTRCCAGGSWHPDHCDPGG